ncbi:MAG: M16 family metallopeptidase [Candidatus Dormibacteria bacterium]
MLTSGARVILAPLPGRTSVAVTLLFEVGSRWEPKRLAGVSHFLEHAVFKGTRRYPDSRAVSEAIEGVGGVLNASTDKEVTNFWAQVPRQRLALAIDVLSDLALAPRFDPEEMERERKVVTEELNMYLDQPAEVVQMDFDQLIWGEHPLARDPAGTRASLGRIGAPELARYHASFYRPERLVVVISGGFGLQRALRLLERRLEPALSAPPTCEPFRAEDGGSPGRLEPIAEVKVRRRRAEQMHLLLGVRCSSYLAPDRWTLDVLNTALGEGMSSRLFLELRERQALAYDVHSFTARHKDSGALAVYLATQPERAASAAAAALTEVRRLAQEPLSAPELERTKAQIEGRLLLQMESAGAVSEFLGHQELLTGGILAAAEVVENVRSVSRDQVQSLAAELLAGGGWRLAAVGSGVGREELLESLGG